MGALQIFFKKGCGCSAYIYTHTHTAIFYSGDKVVFHQLTDGRVGAHHGVDSAQLSPLLADRKNINFKERNIL